MSAHKKIQLKAQIIIIRPQENTPTVPQFSGAGVYFHRWSAPEQPVAGQDFPPTFCSEPPNAPHFALTAQNLEANVTEDNKSGVTKQYF